MAANEPVLSNGHSTSATDKMDIATHSTPPSTAPSSPRPSRPHSASISSVHFLHPLPHRDSTSSLRPAPSNSLPLAKTRSTSPIRSPSTSHTVTPSKSHHVQVQSPSAPPHGTDYFTRKNSQDRRVRSEGSPLTRANRSGSLIGKRASQVTGGYESSSSDDSSDPGNALNHLTTIPVPMSARSRTSMPASQSFSASNRLAFGGVGRHHSDEGRRRAMSLMSPTMEETGVSSNGHPNRPKHKSRESSRRSSRDMLRNGHVPDMARKPSVKQEPQPPSTPAAGPSRLKPVEVVREAASPSSDRKGKGRERKPNGLAASLGLGAHNGDAILSTDQINNLLIDSDVSSALRILQGGQLPNRHSLLPPTASISSESGKSRPTSPAQREPFIAHAPPPLTQHGKQNRDRHVSISSSIFPGRDGESSSGHGTTTWASQKQDITQEELHRKRSRAASRAEPEGGHIPFTHHIPIVHTPDDAQSVSTGDTHSIGHPSTGSAEPNGHTPASREKKSGMAGKSRLSQMFHIKRKKSAENVHPEKHNKLEKPVHLPKDPEREREIVERRRREQERADQDAERRRLEMERREAELAQERRYRALTQVAAHPDSERNAYKTSSHLRAYYTLIYSGLENPPRVNPLAILRWKHRTEEQTALKAKWEQDKKANTSLGEFGAVHSSPASLGSRPKPSSTTSNEPASHWRYTIDNITAYNDADGVVNYFIPPRQTFEQRGARSPSPLHARSPSPQAQGSSLTGSVDRPSEGTPRIASPSTASLGIAPSTLSNEPLSRSTSIDRRAKHSVDHREHRLTHRTHHSLSAMGPQSLTHALKVPFEKLGSVARNTRRADTAPPIHTDDESVNRSLPHRLRHGPLTKLDWRSPAEDERQQRDLHDRQREFHLRKLFLKGQRLPDRPDMDRQGSGGAKVHDRDAELRALERALVRETAFRERQAEAERQTVQEEQARARLRQLEDEIYAERSKHVVKARQRLDGLNVNLDVVAENVRHYFAQIDQLTSVLKTTAEVDVTFANLGPIRMAYARKPDSKSLRVGEQADVLGPLRSPHDSGSGTESRRSGSRQNSVAAARRKASLGPAHLPPILAMGMKPWPRRTSLDPDGTARVNPMRRVELTINYARNYHSTILRRRDETLVQLRSMISTIDSLIKQKDALRSWTKAALESNRNLRNTRDSLIADLKGNTSLRMGRFRDALIDGGVRTILGPLAQVFLFFSMWFKWFIPWSDGGTARTIRRRRMAARGEKAGYCGVLGRVLVFTLVVGLGWAVWVGHAEEKKSDGRFEWIEAKL